MSNYTFKPNTPEFKELGQDGEVLALLVENAVAPAEKPRSFFESLASTSYSPNQIKELRKLGLTILANERRNPATNRRYCCYQLPESELPKALALLEQKEKLALMKLQVNPKLKAAVKTAYKPLTSE